MALPSSACGLQKGEEHGALFLGSFMVQLCSVSLSPTSHRPELIPMTVSNCKGGWKMWPHDVPTNKKVQFGEAANRLCCRVTREGLNIDI